MDGQVDIAQHHRRTFALGLLIAEAHIFQRNAVFESPDRLRMLRFGNLILIVHEVEDGRRGADRLLEIVVVGPESPDWVVHLEQRNDEGEERALGHGAVPDLVASHPQQRRNRDGSDEIHQGRCNRLGSHRPQVGPEQPFRRLAEAQQLPELHVESLHDAIAGDRLVQDVLNVGQLVLPAARGPAHVTSDPENGRRRDDTKHWQHPGQLAPERDHDHHHAGQRAGLLQKIRQDRRRRVLNPFDVVDQRRQQGPRGVLLEERHRPAQDRLVQIVAHVGDHAEAGVIRQVGSGVVADALQQRCGNKGERDHAPVVLDMQERWHQDLRR